MSAYILARSVAQEAGLTHLMRCYAIYLFNSHEAGHFSLGIARSYERQLAEEGENTSLDDG